MQTYKDFIPLTINLAPQITKIIRQQEVEKFSEENGLKREDLSSDKEHIYELDVKLLPQFAKRSEKVIAAVKGSKLIPEVLVIGLISAYDGFLASLLKVIIASHPEIVLTSQKELTFKELLEFSSIQEARSTIIEREVESVIRLSHHEQFDWMQKHLDVKLKEGLNAWPKFIELCERRNLFTHTGGIVSSQYIRNCQFHNCDISGISVGQKLAANGKYFREAVNTIYEIGLKLCYVFWRKFRMDETNDADVRFNACALDLISTGSIKLAESLLEFSHKVPKIKDDVRRMMIVNLANCARLQGRKIDAEKILSTADWSATTDEFKLCVASVKGEIEEVLNLMDLIGKREDPNNYRIWPVFRETRDDPRFVKKFEDIYGEPFLNITTSQKIESGSEELEKENRNSVSPDSEEQNLQKTVH